MEGQLQTTTIVLTHNQPETGFTSHHLNLQVCMGWLQVRLAVHLRIGMLKLILHKHNLMEQLETGLGFCVNARVGSESGGPRIYFIYLLIAMLTCNLPR